MNNAIYLEAERLRKKYNTRDPFELLEAANVVVDFTREFPKNGLKGFCTIINRTRYVVINARLCEEEQRVVAGHEAGHIILHMDDLKIGAFKDSDIYQAKSKKEREANFFSADFLISDDEVLDAMKLAMRTSSRWPMHCTFQSRFSPLSSTAWWIEGIR